MPPDTVTFQQQVAQLIAELLASANSHDTDRHCAVYARDAALIFIVNGEVIRGWDAYRERQREALGDDLGLTTAVIVARAELPDGQIRQRELVASALWKRRPEGWRIVYAHESSTK